MKTLLDDRFAPVTWEIGFLHTTLERAVAACEEWQAPRAEIEVRRLHGSLEHDLLPALLPLTKWGRLRKLLVPVGSEWVAYFDSDYDGADVGGSIRHMSRIIGCEYVRAGAKPFEDSRNSTQRGLGAIIFGWARPGHVIRYIQLNEDQPRWEIHFMGEVQPFEETERYAERRIRNRFDSAMLERYCRAIGIDIFTPEAYGPEGVVIDSTRRRPDFLEPGERQLLDRWKREAEIDIAAGREPRQHSLPPHKSPPLYTLEESQEYMGVQPGLPSTLPG